MGVSLTAPRAAIANNKFIVGFNTIEHAQPELNEISVPDRPFFVLASQELLRIAANYAVTTNIQGKSFHKEDSDGYMGFRASYSADAMATGISIRTTGVPSMLKADVSLSMQAGGGISTPSIDPTTW
jgi:hypothetical protein